MRCSAQPLTLTLDHQELLYRKIKNYWAFNIDYIKSDDLLLMPSVLMTEDRRELLTGVLPVEIC